MGRKNVLVGVAFFLAACVGLLAPVRGATPGTPAADSALNFDPFNPSATPAASGSSSTAATAAANTATVVTPSATVDPRTPVCPPTIYICVNDPPTAIQGTTANSTQTFTVSLSIDNTTPVTVHYATSDGTAKAGVDYVAKSGTLTFPVHTTSLPVTITILKETAAQVSSNPGALKNYFLNLTNATGATIICTKGTGDIQPPVIFVATSNPPPIDQSTTAFVRATFTVTLSSPSTTPVTVTYATSDGTAKQNVDYQPVTGTLTFPPGVTSMQVKVWINPGSATTNRTFFLNLSDASGAPGVKISVPKATEVIVGQNGSNNPGLSVNDVYVTQSKTSNVTGEFLVTLSTGSKNTVTVHYATADVSGGAVAGVDYLPTSGTLTFAPGQTSLPVPFTVLAGDLATDKIFHLILSNAVGAPISRGQGTATITPPMLGVSVNDAAPVQQSGLHTTTSTFTVTLSGLSAKSVTVEYSTSDDTAIHGTDYVATSGILTFTPYTLVKTVNVTVLPGSSSTNRNFYLNLNNPSAGVIITRAQGNGPILGHQCGCVTISVNDITVNQSKTSNTTATFTVSLMNTATVPVTVHYATADGPNPGPGGGAEAGEDYIAKSGTLTFPVGTTSLPVTITIKPESETYAEKFFLNLTNPTGAVISRAQGSCTIIPATIDIAVSDAAPVHRSTTANTYAVFSVTLSSISTSTITVKYTTADGSAVHGTDYTTTSGTLTFAPLTTTQSVQVTVPPAVQTTNKTFFLNLSNATGAGAVISRAQGQAIIDAQLAVPPPVLSVNDISVVQSKTLKVTASFVVSLSKASSVPVTFHYATANGGASAGSDYTAASGTGTIAAGKTTVSIPITILPENENFEESFQLNLTSPSGATIGDAQGTCTIIPATIDVTVNNPALVQRSKTADTTVAFTVTLSSPSNSAITVEYATSDGTAVHGNDYDAASGTLTFGPGQTTMTVKVTALPGSGTTTKTFFLNLLDAVGPGAVITTPKGTGQIKG